MAGNASHRNASHVLRCTCRSPKRSLLCSRGAVLPLLPSNNPRHFGSSPEGRQERQNVRAGAASGAAADFPQQVSPDAPGIPLSSKAEEDMSIGDHGALHAIDIGASGASSSPTSVYTMVLLLLIGRHSLINPLPSPLPVHPQQSP